MEKSFKLKLTDDQKREIAEALGVSIDQVGLQVAYAQAFDEDARGNDAVIASVGEQASDGKVWVVEQLSMAAHLPDGSSLAPINTANVAGGVKINPAEATKVGDKASVRFNPAQPSLPGQTALNKKV